MSLWLFQGEDVHISFHGVAGIKHCINDAGRIMTLMLSVSCSNCQNLFLETDKESENHSVCKLDNSNNQAVSSCGSTLKWLSNCDIYSDAMKGDVCSWVKKALNQGRLYDTYASYCNIASV